jgi:gamma-glutamylcyclotransferase (GGCT)/AIG2-like uncharacterized protein YtfP
MQNYVRRPVRHKHYPGIIEQQGVIVHGYLVYLSSERELQLLDEYEGIFAVHQSLL